MLPVTPRGFKDVLPEEARWRERITTDVQRVLSLWGYAPIETPTLEVLDVLEQAGTLNQTSFRLFDSDGALLVLRPDVTLPIARMVASRLPNVSQPLRLRYVQRVFREVESLRGQAREFTQIGIESIGMSGAVADAEVILLLVEALKACGLERFSLAICTVGVLRDLLDICVDEGDVDAAWRAAVLAAFHENNLVDIETLASSSRVDPRYGRAIRTLPGFRGGLEAIKACRALVDPLGCTGGLDELARCYEVIERAGAGAFVTVDFSVMSTFDYYTGLVFEAYAPGLGVPLGSGGRYDSTLGAFGKQAPAAGFAFVLERVMHALLGQGTVPEASGSEPAVAHIVFDEDDPAAAFLEAARFREQGIRTVLSSGEDDGNA
ncbi:MAG: ATP phosphoribosyltransferase regulatory subunit [Coriobacteriales bacterium]|jgi:ATP phosphoribosyltransferase regulatory subunit|nr:ATP phosphoribosyltransferase regulatory subunit [Coriobacteriales bacterium]